jgi:hypothetical protein
MRHRKLSMPELHRVDVATFRQQPKSPVVLMLDNVRSLQNVGAMFRTADAFGIESLALCGITGCPPHRELHNAALGAEDSVAWHYFASAEDALTQFRAQGYKILVLEQCEGSVLLNQVLHNVTEKWVFVVGNEVEGVTQSVASVADLCVEIPQRGTKHSLNVATAAGILLWEWLRGAW